jgi:hypothetical protein
LFFGDDHGGEAVVDCRDAYWASGGSAVTDSLLVSTVWVVGAVFVDQNAPALGGILNQQGVGNSTVDWYGEKCLTDLETQSDLEGVSGVSSDDPIPGNSYYWMVQIHVTSGMVQAWVGQKTLKRNILR